jgi:hypothetical protein
MSMSKTDKPDKVAYEKVRIKLSNMVFTSVKRHEHLNISKKNIKDL